MESVKVKAADIKKQWVLIDAKNKTLGRLATEIARILRGKNKATFTPNLDTGDNVIVINAKEVRVTGTKEKSKYYYHHTSYIGGIKAISVEETRRTHPERLIESAVRGMIPRNKLGRSISERLKVYGGADHPHAAQAPVAPSPRLKDRDAGKL